MGCYLQSENAVVTKRRAVMPASVNENVTATLMYSLSKCKPENANGEVPLEQRMAASAQRVLHANIEYEVSTDTYNDSVLQKLKAKYTGQTEHSLMNGVSSQNGGKVNGTDSNPCLPTPAKVLFPLEMVQMHWPLRCGNGSGFTNAGNTCYLNSVLQALFHIPPLFNWLTEGDQLHQRSCNSFINSNADCIVCCMANTLKESQKRTGSDTRPHLILARLRSICKRLMPGQQEDAMEFLRYLFEAMEKSYLQRFNGLKLDSFSKETTPLNQIFGGYIRTDVTCFQCRGVSTTFQHFLDLTLDISRGSTLDHALETYFSQEKLEGDNSYKCEKCRRKVQAAKQFFIERLPNVLCIQLKRFNIEGKKISKNIVMSERINLQRFLSRPKLQANHQMLPRPAKGAWYRLQAGVNHLGHTAQSGHYTTTAYTANGGLYHFDDSCVQKSWSRTFTGSDVYLLMFVLESPRQDIVRPVTTSLATATTTSQSLQKATNFIPVQCRATPNVTPNRTPNKIVFNTMSHVANEPLVAPTKSPSEIGKNKSPVTNKVASKLVYLPPSPAKDTSAMPSSSGVKPFAVIAPTPSPPIISMKPRNKPQCVPNGFSLPVLVPYSEEHSSDEDSANERVNGWTVTHHQDTKKSDILDSNNKKLPEPPCSKLIPKVNGIKAFIDPVKKNPQELVKSCSSEVAKNSLQDKKLSQELIKKTCKPVITNENGRKSSQDTENSSVAGSECSVRSTSAAWQVSTEAQPTVPAVEPRAATADWVVTSNPTSAEQSPGTLPSTPSPSRAKQHDGKPLSNGNKRKRSRRSSSSSSDGSPSHSRPKVWVERTKETIHNSQEQRWGGEKRPAPEPRADAVVDSLKRMSYAGYGGAQVSTWNGGRSLVERQARDDFFERRRQHNEDCDYNSEMDGGRKKKIKTYHRDDEYARTNRFQQESDYRRNNYDERGNGWGPRRDHYNNNRWHSKSYGRNHDHFGRSNNRFQRNNHWNNHRKRPYNERERHDYHRNRNHFYEHRNRR